MEGMNETNVDVVGIYFSDILFIMPEVYTTFPNMNVLDIEFCALEVVDPLPSGLPNFEYFFSFFNWVEVIQNNTFENVGETLLWIDFELNELEEIELDAFVGCESLEVVEVYYNRIVQPPVGTFAPLTNLLVLDIATNRLGFIDETLLANNTELFALFVEDNRIDRIAPNFSSTFTLEVFAAYDNECIDRGFDIDDPIVLAFMHASLQRCYDAFVGIEPNATRTVRFEFQGPLRLSDEFGNPILITN